MPDWIVYSLSPIDFEWDLLSTVEETAKKIATREARDRLSEDSQFVSSVDGYELHGFVLAWTSAQAAATAEGWEGDFRGDPVVFWTPTEGTFTPGFAFKQDNNGTTYVVSRVELPHLRD